MRISQVEAVPIRVHLAAPIRMASGTIEHTDNVLVRITSDEDVSGGGGGGGPGGHR